MREGDQPAGTVGFAGYRHIHSAAQAEAWVREIVRRNGGTREHISYPEDVAIVVRHFRDIGATITPEEAQALWEAYSEKDHAGWVGPASDCVAGLDWTIEQIEDGTIAIRELARLKGWRPNRAEGA